jgi:hypothetical protein
LRRTRFGVTGGVASTAGDGRTAVLAVGRVLIEAPLAVPPSGRTGSACSSVGTDRSTRWKDRTSAGSR